MPDYAVEQDTYEEDEASYDASDWCYRVVDLSIKDEEGAAHIICLCADKMEAGYIAGLLIAHPIPFGEKVVTGAPASNS